MTINFNIPVIEILIIILFYFLIKWGIRLLFTKIIGQTIINLIHTIKQQIKQNIDDVKKNFSQKEGNE